MVLPVSMDWRRLERRRPGKIVRVQRLERRVLLMRTDRSTLTATGVPVPMGMQYMERVTKIPVYVCHGKFLLFDAEDVIRLRREHRVIGCCQGSLPWKPRQVLHGSLPLRLSAMEITFLVKRDIVVLKDGSSINEMCFTDVMKQEIFESRQLQRDVQSVLLKEQKSVKLDNLAPTIMEGMLQKHHDRADGSAQVMEFESFKSSEIEKSSKPKENLWLEMPIASTVLINMPTIMNHDFGLSLNEKLLCDVFADLHDQGFYMSNACKFGGDFLVYPGDPVMYHSFYIAICVPYNKKILGTEYSRYGRLANTVRKTVLICSRDENDRIRYLSISWTGISQSEGKKSNR